MFKNKNVTIANNITVVLLLLSYCFYLLLVQVTFIVKKTISNLFMVCKYKTKGEGSHVNSEGIFGGYS